MLFSAELRQYAPSVCYTNGFELGYENETIDISGFNGEIKKAKMLYFAKVSLTSDILLSKLGMATNVLRRKLSKGTYGENTIIRNKKFDDFCIEHFRLSEKYNSKADLSNKCKDEYGAVLVGSDQLWLPGNIAGDYYTLNFVSEKVNTIAYATSFGQSTLPSDSAKKAAVFFEED